MAFWLGCGGSSVYLENSLRTQPLCHPLLAVVHPGPPLQKRAPDRIIPKSDGSQVADSRVRVIEPKVHAESYAAVSTHSQPGPLHAPDLVLVGPQGKAVRCQ